MTNVVAVHGLIGNFADSAAVDELGPVQFLAPDLIGYGSFALDSTATLTIGAQVQHLHRAICRRFGDVASVHLVGHSVGAVIGAAYADHYPARVTSLVSVEGNFTLRDAFWSTSLAASSPWDVCHLIDGYRDDPAGWLRDAGVEPSESRITAAVEALTYQPALTVQATARAVVRFTGGQHYESLLRRVFAKTRVHLVAGSRSRSEWDVPDWALTAAASYTDIADVGHLMMLENPQLVGRQLRSILDSDVDPNG